MPNCPHCNVFFSSVNKHIAKCPKTKEKQAGNVNAVANHARVQEERAREEAEAAAAAAAAAFDVPMRDPTPPPPERWEISRREKRSSRARQLPARYRDIIPDPVPVAELAPVPPRAQTPPAQSFPGRTSPTGSIAAARGFYRTKTNFEKLYKVYPQQPTHDPDAYATLESSCDSSHILQIPREPITAPPPPLSRPTFFPFSSYSAAWLMAWYLESVTLSLGHLRRLVDFVFRRPTFKISELLSGFDPQKEWTRLERATTEFSDELPKGWKAGEVTIKLPPPPGHGIAEKDAPTVTIKNIRYRPLLDILAEAVSGRSFELFHTTPHALRLDPRYDPTSVDEELDDADVELDASGIPLLPDGHQDMLGEIYTSPEMLHLHSKLPPPSDGCVESVVAAYMFWSDGTQVARFGDASVWPKYTGFGNVSKDIRCKPTRHACYHSAYFTSVPEWVKDKYKTVYNVKNISSPTLAHLKRELIHAIWDQLLLTPEFIHAYLHGLPLECFDKLLRLFFPRFLTYGADYIEKVLLALIRANGGCPCIHCVTPKARIQDIGKVNDVKRRELNARKITPTYLSAINRAREFIFEYGFSIQGNRVEGLLKPFSWVTTRNAFYKITEEADPAFNLYDMFVPDVLHELELGIMKAMLIHILRILDATTNELDEFDKRFRAVPAHGRTTIRPFRRNVSEMKQFAARDFEDTFQCILPVLDGLFIDGKHDRYNALILDVCFDLLAFHGFAKMRLHTTASIARFRIILRSLGKSLRRFHRETTSIVTVELPKEREKRLRSKSKKASKSKTLLQQEKPLEKPFNINTPKTHLIGYYPDAIERMGTTDSYSSQICETLHKGPKAGYQRTNKRNVEAQLSAQEHRERITRQTVERMEEEERAQALTDNNANLTARDGRANLQEPENEPLPETPPRVHHQIGESRRTPWILGNLPTLPGLPMSLDPSYKGWSRRVKVFFRQQLTGASPDTEYNDSQLNDVIIERDRLYSHAFMCLNYTTYDRKRDQDLISPRTGCNIMLEADPDATDGNHPFIYARVLGILHGDVRLRSTGDRSRRVELLWLRYYELDTTVRFGWDRKRLPRVTFIAHDDPAAFGFLNPDDVVRSAHLIPHFRTCRTTTLLPRSIARQFDPPDDDDDADWNYYSVNWFVDRDMLSRYVPELFGPRMGLAPPSVERVQTDADPESADEDEGDVGSLTVDVNATIRALMEDIGDGDVEMEEGDPDGDLEEDEEDLLEGEEKELDEEDEEDEEDENEDTAEQERRQDPALRLRGDEAALDRAGFAQY